MSYETLKRETISQSFDVRRARDQQRYMLVYYDGHDQSYYTVGVEDDADYFRSRKDPMYSIGNQQRLMEVYNLSMDKETQLSEHRSMHGPIAGQRLGKSLLFVDEAPFHCD